MSTEVRQRVDRQQAAVLAALVAGAPDPAAFDDGRLASTRDALLRKRAREAAQAWPELSLCVGTAYEERFVRWATDVPFPAEGGAHADGFGFAARAVGRRELDTRARLELLDGSARYRCGSDGVARVRRGPWAGAVLTPDGLALAWSRRRGSARRIRLRAPVDA